MINFDPNLSDLFSTDKKFAGGGGEYKTMSL